MMRCFGEWRDRLPTSQIADRAIRHVIRCFGPPDVAELDSDGQSGGPLSNRGDQTRGQSTAAAGGASRIPPTIGTCLSVWDPRGRMRVGTSSRVITAVPAYGSTRNLKVLLSSTPGSRAGVIWSDLELALRRSLPKALVIRVPHR